MAKTAFITGAGGYIGSETAVLLAKDGINIAVCDINREAVDKTVARIRAFGGTAGSYVCDVTDAKALEEIMRQAASDLGGPDIAVHVAGGSARIAGGSYVPLIEQTDEVIDKVLKVNLYGAIWMSRAAARILKEQGRGGKIVLFASAVGLNGLSGCTEYAASKGGVMSLTRSLAKELGAYKINVNADDHSSPDRAYKTNYLGEKCTGEDIAALVEFLVSDKARFITGQTYVCDGGRTLAMKGSD